MASYVAKVMKHNKFAEVMKHSENGPEHMAFATPKFIDATTWTSIPILQILPAITTETPHDADSPSLLNNSCRREKNSIHQL